MQVHMKQDDLLHAIEICLRALEDGADVETCLGLYPTLADDLRPVLHAAQQARQAKVDQIPAAALLRGRLRLLQTAQKLREKKGHPAG